VYEQVKNSMEAVLAEISIEDVKDEADDKDFVTARGHNSIFPLDLSDNPSADEEDIFESDFESTDEEAEAAQQATEAGEGQVVAEERRDKKVHHFIFSQPANSLSITGSPKPR